MADESHGPKNKLHEVKPGQVSSTMEEITHRAENSEIKRTKHLSIGSPSAGEQPQQSNEPQIATNKENWEPKQDCCIYTVPKLIRELNAEAYTPSVVSIGPLHHGKPELAFMEYHKQRYARMFREKSLEKWMSLQNCIQQDMKIILNCYEDPLKFADDKLEEIFLLDAIFIIEFLLNNRPDGKSDILHRRLQLKGTILTDFILLENQLPYFLLEKLYKEGWPDQKRSFRNLGPIRIFTFFSADDHRAIKDLQEWDIKHFTDLQRYSFLDPKQLGKQKGDIKNLPSATKLHGSGVKFEPVKEYLKLFDFEFMPRKHLIPLFNVDVLHMPKFKIQDNTEIFIRNVMALEQCHYPHDTHFCSFIHLLDKLVDTKEDVEFLVEKGIIVSFLGDHSSTAKMINKLTKNIYGSRSCFTKIANDLEKHYQNGWNHKKAILMNVYFNNPWRGTATFTAAMLLLLTLVGTIFSVLQFFLRK